MFIVHGFRFRHLIQPSQVESNCLLTAADFLQVTFSCNLSKNSLALNKIRYLDGHQ